MSSFIPIGAVCPFAGQVNPVSGAANGTWANSSCAGSSAKPAQLSADAPLLYLESQGWMLCDGRWLASSGFPELFAVIGYLYGRKSEGGVDSYRLPDYRGLFLRGFDAGAGLDPDAASRLSPTGGNTANVVGSLQCDALQSHAHQYQVVQPAGISQQGQAAGASFTSQATSVPDAPARSSVETRPRNIAVNYIIRFR
ncbi:phage tail protein [Pseudomonas paraeruginosa]|uniref:phage tail protein n=1 Tax=Pseudomonas paraeruginosa TaxID=2994495 RepID=UPI0039FC5CFC